MRAISKTAHHYSHCFALNVDKLPTKNSDRIALRILYPGLFFGVLLAALGLFDLWFVFDSSMRETSADYIWINPLFMDAVFILLGCGIVFKLLASYLCYRKIFFDGKSVTIVDRKLGGKKITYKENLKNYDGVEMRIEFFQFGILNRNRYIIELKNKNIHKIAPLYISTSSKNIRQIWKNYAKALNLPAIISHNGETKTIEVDDLDKSLKFLAKEGKVVSTYNADNPLPEHIVLVRKRDKKVIKMMKILWDGYNFIMMFFLAAFIAVWVFEMFCSALSWWVFALGALVWAWAVALLFRRDKIAVKKAKLVLVHKFPLLNFKNNEIFKDDIEAIEVEENPATGRHFLAIYSKNKSVVFGKKLPLNTLVWVQNFLIDNVIK